MAYTVNQRLANYLDVQDGYPEIPWEKVAYVSCSDWGVEGASVVHVDLPMAKLTPPELRAVKRAWGKFVEDSYGGLRATRFEVEITISGAFLCTVEAIPDAKPVRVKTYQSVEVEVDRLPTRKRCIPLKPGAQARL